MKKLSLFYKNFLYFIIFVIFGLTFLFTRTWQLLFLTNLENGMCYSFEIFNRLYIVLAILFFVISFTFFKFIAKPVFKNFSFINNNYLIGFFSFLSGFTLLISSFFILFGTKSEFSISPGFNLFFFLTGIFFSISLFYLAFSLFSSTSNCKNALKLFFYASFFWFSVRLFSLFLSNLFLRFAKTEYFFITIGSVAIFLSIFHFGRISLNISDISNASDNFMIYGFFGILILFANVIPKLLVEIYNFFKNLDIMSTYFIQNIKMLNFYNFNLVDLSIAILFFSIIISANYNNFKLINK